MINVKEIEALRIKAGETLVIVPDRPLPTDYCEDLHSYFKKVGVNAIIVPPGTKLFVAEPNG